MLFPFNYRSGLSDRNTSSPPSAAGRCIAALALACAVLAAPARAAAADLGRLFLTPEQRQDLDRRRATNRAEEEAPQIREGPLTLEGHVQRSSGKTATWINGVPQYDGDPSRDPAQVKVVPNAGEPSVNLKVGEIYDRASGKVVNGLDGGTITVGKSVAKRRSASTHEAATPAAPSR